MSSFMDSNTSSISNDKVQISVAGVERLRAEIGNLRDVERPKAVSALASSRELGDLSENAEYEASRNNLNILDAKIAELEYLLQSVDIVDIATLPDDGIIRFGSKVLLEELTNGKKITIALTSEFESDSTNGMLSIKAPLSRALLNSKKGDIVSINAPSGTKEYEVLEVKVNR